MIQAQLFEPRVSELAGMCEGHLKCAGAHARRSEVFEARGMLVLAGVERLAAGRQELAAEELGMLAELYSLAGLLS